MLAHQHLSQLDPVIRDAVFGNVGSLVSFRVGVEDAAYLGREFAPVFSAVDLIGLPRFSMYLKLQIREETAKPFSATAERSVAKAFSRRPAPFWPKDSTAAAALYRPG